LSMSWSRFSAFTGRVINSPANRNLEAENMYNNKADF
jgi:hypothetical protein